MALQFAHGAIQWLAADGATTVYTVSGLPFQPKALRFYWQGLGSAVDAASQTIHSRRGIGFASGTGDQRCVGSQDQDAAPSMVCTSGYRTDCVAMTLTSTPAADGRLRLDSITSDGFTLEVDDQAPVDITVFWEAWGGEDIKAAATGEIAEPAATGQQTYTPNLQASVIMFAGVQATGAAPTAERTDSGLHVGRAINPNLRTTGVYDGDVVGNSDDGSANSDTDGAASEGEVIIQVAVGGGSLDAIVGIVSIGSTTFTLNWGTRALTGRKNIYLAIEGGAWELGRVSINTSSVGNPVTITGLPFQPKGLSLVSRFGTTDSLQIQDRILIGSASSPTDRRSMGHLSENATGSAEIDLVIEYDQVLSGPSTTGTLLTALDLSAITADGFTLVTDVAGGTGFDHVYWLAFGDTPPTWTQPVQGVGALRASQGDFWRRAVRASTHAPLPFVAEVPPEPDTVMQPVQGTAFLQSTQRDFWRHGALAGQAQPYGDFNEGPTENAIAPELQQVQGTGSLRRTATAFWRNAVAAWQAQQAANDPEAAADVYTQPVQGTASLAVAALAFWTRAVTAQQAQPFAEPTDGPVGDQPDTVVQPVQGTASLQQAARAFWRNATATQPQRTTVTGDVEPQAEEPSTYQGWYPGVIHLNGSTALHAEWERFYRRAARAAQAAPYGDFGDGPLDAQPDTWTQAVQGTGSLARYAAAFRARAVQASSALSQAIATPPGVVGHNNIQPSIVVYMWRRTG